MSPAPDWRDRYAAGLLAVGQPERYLLYADRLFEVVELAGRRMLDIGGGSGLISFYAAARGAQVVCLEPTAEGSNPAMDASFQRLDQALGDIAPVELDRRTLQQLEAGRPGGEEAGPPGFDLLVLHNSVNHLDEDACTGLRRDPAARATYARLFGELRSMAKPGADLIVSDCSRLNLWGALRLRNPFVPEIEWHLHQQPRVWAALARDAGFEPTGVQWNAMTRAGRPGALLLSNWLGAFATQSHFTLRARAAG